MFRLGLGLVTELDLWFMLRLGLGSWFRVS
jgi:hypothetical protein